MLLSAAVLYLLLFITGGIEKNRKWLSVFAKFIIPVCGVTIIIFTIVYVEQLNAFHKNIVVMTIDKLLSSRVKLGAYGYDKYGITFLGQNLSNYKVTWDQEWRLNAHTFDDVYTYCAMNVGIVWLVLITVMFYKLADRHSDKINIFIIIWALYGISEVHVLNGYVFFPILMIMMTFEPSVKCGTSKKLMMCNINSSNL